MQRTGEAGYNVAASYFKSVVFSIPVVLMHSAYSKEIKVVGGSLFLEISHVEFVSCHILRLKELGLLN